MSELRRNGDVGDVGADEPVPYEPAVMIYRQASEIVQEIVSVSALMYLNCELGVFDRDEALEEIYAIQDKACRVLQLLSSVEGMEAEL